MITQHYLKTVLGYDELTGLFTWKRNGGGSCIGDIAGSLAQNGYIIIGIDGDRYLAHRLAMIYVHGSCGEEVDHLNGIRDFNPISNLRNVTSLENSRNMSMPKSNKSGVVGVSRDKVNDKWRATIKVNYKQIAIGRFNSFNDAVQARVNAEKEHGFHLNHGKTL